MISRIKKMVKLGFATLRWTDHHHSPWEFDSFENWVRRRRLPKNHVLRSLPFFWLCFSVFFFSYSRISKFLLLLSWWFLFNFINLSLLYQLFLALIVWIEFFFHNLLVFLNSLFLQHFSLFVNYSVIKISNKYLLIK